MVSAAVVEYDSPHDLFLKVSYAVTKLPLADVKDL